MKKGDHKLFKQLVGKRPENGFEVNSLHELEDPGFEGVEALFHCLHLGRRRAHLNPALFR